MFCVEGHYTPPAVGGYVSRAPWAHGVAMAYALSRLVRLNPPMCNA